MASELSSLETWQHWAREQFPDMDARKLVILEALRRGNARSAAIAIIPITYQTLLNWIQRDQEFSEAVERAEAVSQIELVGMVRKAAATDWKAAMALLERRNAKDWQAAEQRLASLRGEVEAQKKEANLALAQAQELSTRAERNKLEASMWAKQFVTEQDQESMIQTLAASVNKPLLQLTPEKFASLMEGLTPEQQLETLKGYLGRAQADIVEEVMLHSRDKEEDQEEEEEDGG